MIETEVKHKIKNKKELQKTKQKIKKIAEYKKTETEYNIVFDSPDFSLRKKGFLLRLRKDSKNTLTFKSKIKSKKFKKRQETEFQVKDFNKTKKIIEKKGFIPVFVYEKKRTYFDFNGTEIQIDELPFIGFYLEIEGTEKGIKETEKKLGLKEKNRKTTNYLQLFVEWKKKHKRKEKNMIFD